LPLEGTVSVTALQINRVVAEAAAPIHFVGVAVNDNKPPEEGSLAFILGELRGEVRGFREDMAEVKEALADASTSRGQLSEKISIMDTRLQKVESTVTVMGGVVDTQTQRVDKIEPIALWLILIASGLLLVGGALWFGILNYGTAVIQWLASVLPKAD
jgi:hypothetical protein